MIFFSVVWPVNNIYLLDRYIATKLVKHDKYREMEFLTKYLILFALPCIFFSFLSVIGKPK